MKRNIILFATLMMVAFPLLFTNCSNDPVMDAVAPTFEKVVLSSNSVNAGESVTATITIKSMGKSWYNFHCDWTLTNYAQDPAYSIKGEGNSRDMKEPSFSINIPDDAPAGMYTLRITNQRVEAQSLFPDGTLKRAAILEDNSATMTITEAEHPEDESEE